MYTHRHQYLIPQCRSSKLDVYYLVYFCRPKCPDDAGNTPTVLLCNYCNLKFYTLTDKTRDETILRFKDKETCLKIFKRYVKARIRCLITRVIYSMAEVDDLCITDCDLWKVRCCRPRLRRDQIAKGLCKLYGVDDKTGRDLARRIPSEAYPADIHAVKKYCCKNFCKRCHGARLHGDISVCGFASIPKGDEQLLTLSQYCKPKSEQCEWRLAKRRIKDENGKLLSHSWLTSCVQCSAKYQASYDRHNA